MAIGSIALGALMTGAGLFSLLLAALFLRGLRNLASETFLPRLMARRWPRVAGTIITAEVHESPKNPGGVSFLGVTQLAGGHSGDEPSNGGWPPGGWLPWPHTNSPLSATDTPPAAKRLESK